MIPDPIIKVGPSGRWQDASLYSGLNNLYVPIWKPSILKLNTMLPGATVYFNNPGDEMWSQFRYQVVVLHLQSIYGSAGAGFYSYFW